MKHPPSLRRFSRFIPAVALLCFGLELSLALAGPFPSAWRFWRYSRPVLLATPSQPRLVSVVVPLDVFARAKPFLHDLRVIDDQGREVPYVLFARHGYTRRETRSTRLLENSFSPGRFSQVVLDLAEKPPFHNSVIITTPEPDFIAWVEVAVSDAPSQPLQWRILRDRAPIYRFQKQSLEGVQSISYSETNARYIRLRFLDGSKPFPVAHAQAAFDVSEQSERAPLPIVLAPAASSAPDRSSWRADLGTPNVPIAEVRFEVAQPEFNRSVLIEASPDGESWSQQAAGKIFRFRQKDILEESLTVGFAEVHEERFWRVAVVNGNDPPLAAAQPALFTTPRHVVFRQELGRAYRLLYGQSEAPAPSYELSRMTARKALEDALPGSLGDEEVNSAYADPRPWTEQHPLVLWLALAVAVVLLAYSALRAFLSP